MDISIVLVNWNSSALVEQCLNSLEQSGTHCAYEVIISDNASRHEEAALLRAVTATRPNVRCLFSKENGGFGAGNNRALPYCRGRYVLFLNTDTLVLEPLDALVAAADALGPRCGALGGRVLNADHSLQLTCREAYTVPVMVYDLTLAFTRWRPGFVRRQQLASWDHASARDVAMLSGCYLLVPRAVLDAVGGFDERIFLFYEDTELCWRIIQAGYTVRYVPISTIIHLEGGVTRAGGLSARTLLWSAQGARYFTRKTLGRGHARMLVTSVWLLWLAMWLLLALLSLVMPIPRVRFTLGRRARLLREVLIAMPRQRIPAPTSHTVVGMPVPMR